MDGKLSVTLIAQNTSDGATQNLTCMLLDRLAHAVRKSLGRNIGVGTGQGDRRFHECGLYATALQDLIHATQQVLLILVILVALDDRQW